MRDEKELGKALKRKDSEIVIEGDLSKKVIRIKATGAVAWGVCIAAIAVAVIIILSSPVAAPVSIPAMIPTLGTATAVLGIDATTAALGIAVAGGGVGVLNTLRDYRLEKISDQKVILHRK